MDLIPNSRLLMWQRTYRTGCRLDAAEASGWRRQRGAGGSRRVRAACRSTERRCDDRTRLTAGWSAETWAARSCSCCRRAVRGGTPTWRSSSSLSSWSRPSGLGRTAGCWGTPSRCWQSSGGAGWPGWGRAWVGSSRPVGCEGAAMRRGWRRRDGAPGPAPPSTSACWARGLQRPRRALGGEGRSPVCRRCWFLAPPCSWSHHPPRACSDSCWQNYNTRFLREKVRQASLEKFCPLLTFLGGSKLTGCRRKSGS